MKCNYICYLECMSTVMALSTNIHHFEFFALCVVFEKKRLVYMLICWHYRVVEARIALNSWIIKIDIARNNDNEARKKGIEYRLNWVGSTHVCGLFFFSSFFNGHDINSTNQKIYYVSHTLVFWAHLFTHFPIGYLLEREHLQCSFSFHKFHHLRKWFAVVRARLSSVSVRMCQTSE